ncbi:hypothetical protein PIB30_020656 [Stylosanthes scabra]|uniref:F-box domain-containing protein n=1 Tax=Stylosanthes scabra TaxID=79078 RepID=A0ABU6V6V7_9FABA|nr:hypothetical protein [Stylosanthes scabra]
MECEVPPDLIWEILVRLPAILLLKLKCVCRSWKSLISSPEFAMHHLQYSTLNPSTPLLCWNQGTMTHPIKHGLKEALHKVRTNDTIMHSRYFFNYCRPIPDVFFTYLPIDGAKGIIRGSCNGLLCLSNSGFPLHTLTLLNPTTRSASPTISVPFHPHHQENIPFWGFGYDALHDKYKFVIGCCNSSSSSGAIVCTFGANPCCKTVDHPAFQYHIYGADGIFFNGTLNWTVYDPSTQNSKFGIYQYRNSWSNHAPYTEFDLFPNTEWFLLTFDLETESFGQFCLPPEGYGKPHLQVLNNSTLSVCYRYDYRTENKYIVIWIMKKEEEEQDYSWTKLFKIPNNAGGISNLIIAPLYYLSLSDSHIVLALDEPYHRLFLLRIGTSLFGTVITPQSCDLRPLMYFKCPASLYICHETLLSPEHYSRLTTNT